MEKISVVLVDGNEDFRGLLQEYMERDGAFTVLASVGDGMEALRAVRRLQLLGYSVYADGTRWRHYGRCGVCSPTLL